MKEIILAYDGKCGRAVQGEILFDAWFATWVRLIPWAGVDEGEKTMWVFRRPMLRVHAPGWKHLFRRSSWYWGRGGWLRGDDRLMRMMFGTPGDWYSVIKREWAVNL